MDNYEMVKMAAFFDELEQLGYSPSMLKQAGLFSFLGRGLKAIGGKLGGLKGLFSRGVGRATKLKPMMNASTKSLTSAKPLMNNLAAEGAGAVAAKAAPAAATAAKALPSKFTVAGNFIKAPEVGIGAASRLPFADLLKNQGLGAALGAYKNEAALLGGGLGVGALGSSVLGGRRG